MALAGPVRAGGLGGGVWDGWAAVSVRRLGAMSVLRVFPVFHVVSSGLAHDLPFFGEREAYKLGCRWAG